MQVIQDVRALSFETESTMPPPHPEILQDCNVDGFSLEAHISIRWAQNGHTASTEDKFRRLADQWRKQTRHLSFSHQKINGTYLKIIGMGDSALPLILRELVGSPNPYWFIALEAIAGQESIPAEGASVENIRQAWIAWVRSKGLI